MVKRVNPDNLQALSKEQKKAVLARRLANAPPYDQMQYLRGMMAKQKKGYINASQVKAFDAEAVARLYPSVFSVDYTGAIRMAPITKTFY